MRTADSETVRDFALQENALGADECPRCLYPMRLHDDGQCVIEIDGALFPVPPDDGALDEAA